MCIVVIVLWLSENLGHKVHCMFRFKNAPRELDLWIAGGDYGVGLHYLLLVYGWLLVVLLLLAIDGFGKTRVTSAFVTDFT